MTMLNDAFQKFLGQITIPEAQSKQIGQSRDRLVLDLKNIWGPDKVIPIGSFARGTAVAPPGDVDLMLVLNEGTFDRSQVSAVLSDIQTKLSQRYQGASLRPQRRSVRFTYDNIPFDIIPAEERKAGGFRITDTDAQARIFTDPRKHEAFVAERNKQTDGMAVGIVRMLKVWNKNKQVGLKSFHLEVMALRALGQKPNSYAQGMRDALLRIAEAVNSSCGDPAESGKTLDDYLNTAQRDAIAQRCKQAADALGSAIDEDGRGQSSQAVTRVRGIIGSPF